MAVSLDTKSLCTGLGMREMAMTVILQGAFQSRSFTVVYMLILSSKYRQSANHTRQGLCNLGVYHQRQVSG